MTKPTMALSFFVVEWSDVDHHFLDAAPRQSESCVGQDGLVMGRHEITYKL